jgi:hypothetical protein
LYFLSPDGGLSLGYATTAAAPIVNNIPAVSPLGVLIFTLLIIAAGFATLQS